MKHFFKNQIYILRLHKSVFLALCFDMNSFFLPPESQMDPESASQVAVYCTELRSVVDEANCQINSITSWTEVGKQRLCRFTQGELLSHTVPVLSPTCISKTDLSISCYFKRLFIIALFIAQLPTGETNFKFSGWHDDTRKCGVHIEYITQNKIGAAGLEREEMSKSYVCASLCHHNRHNVTSLGPSREEFTHPQCGRQQKELD